MRRWLRVGVVGFGGVLGVAILVVVGFAASFDPNTQKGRIVEAVRRATGRDLVLAGPLQVTFGLTPTIQAQDAALANRPGGSRPEMATVGRLEARLALLPLLRGRIDIESLTLDRPDILLETDAEGAGNWQFQRPPSAPAAAGGPSAPRRPVLLHRLLVQNGRVTWRNAATGRATTIDVPQATLTLDAGSAHLLVDAQQAGQPVHLDATTSQDGAGPWPVKATLDAAGARLSLDGTVAQPAGADSYRGRIDATIPDLAAIGALLADRLPALHDIRLGMVLAGADQAPQEVTLHVGRSDFGGAVLGGSLDALDLSLPALGQQGRLTASGNIAGGPWQIASGLMPGRQSLAFRGARVTAPWGDVAGDLAFSRGERWALRGSLESQRIDLDGLRQLQRAAVPAAAPTASPPAAPPARLFSDASLPWDRLRLADADLELAVATLHAGGADYHGVSAHLALQDGALRVDPIEVAAPDGRVAGAFTADASQPVPPLSLTLRSAGFSLGTLLQAAGLPAGATAPAEIDVVLHSAGLSAHELAAGLDGHAGLAVVDATVPNAILAAALGNALPAAARIEAGGTTSVRCVALRLDARAGQVNIAALDLQSARLDLEGGGVIDLANETMALRLHPALRFGGAAVAAPVRVSGSLTHPVTALDPAGVEGRTGVVIGGAPAGDCAGALELARDGRAGRAPAAIAMKTPKAADLLRSLLR